VEYLRLLHMLIKSVTKKRRRGRYGEEGRERER